MYVAAIQRLVWPVPYVFITPMRIQVYVSYSTMRILVYDCIPPSSDHFSSRMSCILQWECMFAPTPLPPLIFFYTYDINLSSVCTWILNVLNCTLTFFFSLINYSNNKPLPYDFYFVSVTIHSVLISPICQCTFLSFLQRGLKKCTSVWWWHRGVA